MSNIGFRLLLVRGEDGLTRLGHTPAMLYTCPPTGPKDDSTCAPDSFATEDDQVLGDITLVTTPVHEWRTCASVRSG